MHGLPLSSPPPTIVILFSGDEIVRNAPVDTEVGEFFTIGGVAPYSYALLGDPNGYFRIAGNKLVVNSTGIATAPDSYLFQVRSTGSLGAIKDQLIEVFFKNAVSVPPDVPPDVPPPDTDDGWEQLPVMSTSEKGIKLTGKNGGDAKLLVDFGPMFASEVVTLKFDPDFVGMSQGAEDILLGFGFLAAGATKFHFAGFAQDSGVVKFQKAYGATYGNSGIKPTLATGANAPGFVVAAGPTWLQIEANGAGTHYTLRTSADGASWVDVATGQLPEPLANVDAEPVKFGLAAYVPNQNKGVLQVQIAHMTRYRPITDITLSANTVANDAPVGTVIGVLSTVGGLAPYSYEVLGSAYVNAVGNEVRVAASLTPITGTTHNFDVRTTDSS